MNFIKQYLQKSQSLISFIIIEVLAIMCFGLGGSNTVFFIVGIVLNIFSLPFLVVNSTKKELGHFALFTLPLLLLAFLVSFGNLYRGSGYLFNNLISFLSITSFLMLGYEMRRIKVLNLEAMLISVGCGFALITLISLVITWYNYGIFYGLIYQDTPIYYYNGALFDVTKESSWLLGLSIKEVSLGYSGLFGVVCSVYLLGLLFVNFKQNKRKFCIIFGIGIIGVLSLLTTPNLLGLFLLLPLFGFGVAYKYVPRNNKSKRIIDIILIAISAFIVLGLLLVVLNNISSSFASFVSGNKIFNKALNGLMKDANVVFKDIFKKENFFGFSPTLLNGHIINTNTHMMEVEVMKEGGILALVALLVFIAFVLLSIRSYSKKSSDSPFIKTLVISLLLAIFIYDSCNYDCFPIVHESNSYSPVFRSLPILFLLVLVGLTYYPFLKDIPLYIDSPDFGKPFVLQKKENKTVVDKDYEFDEEDDLDE